MTNGDDNDNDNEDEAKLITSVDTFGFLCVTGDVI